PGPLLSESHKIGGGMASGPIAVLADGVVKAMFLTKLGKLSAIACLCVAFCAGIGAVGYSSMAGEQPVAAIQLVDKKAPAPAEKKAEKPAASSKEEEANLRKQFEANADTFELTISRVGYGSDKVDLRSITLHVANKRFEP